MKYSKGDKMVYMTNAQRKRLLTLSVLRAQIEDKVPTTIRRGKAEIEEGFCEEIPGILSYNFELVKRVDDKRRDGRSVIIATTFEAYYTAVEAGFKTIELVK